MLVPVLYPSIVDGASPCGLVVDVLRCYTTVVNIIIFRICWIFMLVGLQSTPYGFCFMKVCTLITCLLNTCPSSGSQESAQVWGFYSFALISFSLFRLVFCSASSTTSVVCFSGCGFLRLVYMVCWLWLLVSLLASVVGFRPDMPLLPQYFMNALVSFTWHYSLACMSITIVIWGFLFLSRVPVSEYVICVL